MKIPTGAQAVIDARKKGFKPDEMLIISLVGTTGETNHTIHANHKGEYDWRWVVGLDACIFVNSKVDLKPITRAVASAKPKWLGVYNVDTFKGADVWFLPSTKDLERPQSQWRYVLSFWPWLESENQAFAFGD
jgi:hypothetical protein